MVKIWKIGAWPGLWKRNPTPEEKRDLGKRFINEYALDHGFVAIGSAYVKSNIRNLSDKDFRRYVKEGLKDKRGEAPTQQMVSFRVNKLIKFANIRRGDVILLYNDKAVHVGEATLDEEGKEGKSSETPYYYVEKGNEKEGDFIKDTIGIHIAPHRVAVNWKFNKQPFPADFSGGGKYMHRICQVLKEDLEKTIKSKRLRRFLERKLADNEHGELIDKIYEVISPYFQHIFIEGRSGTGEIQVFDEIELIKGEQTRFRIAEADIMVLDEEEKPLLIIEPETSSSPKTFGRSIPIYTIAQKVRIRGRDYSIEFPLLLLIVIPTQQEGGQKAEQLTDLEKKLKKTINWKESNLKDFAICQIGDLKPTLKRLFIDNGYDKYGHFFD